jgi:hypothetical protein
MKALVVPSRRKQGLFHFRLSVAGERIGLWEPCFCRDGSYRAFFIYRGPARVTTEQDVSSLHRSRQGVLPDETFTLVHLNEAWIMLSQGVGTSLSEAKPRDDEGPSRPAGGLADARHIGELAQQRLRSHPYLALKNISCDYQEGVLTLRGCLPTYYLRQMAHAAVIGMDGVQVVVDCIEVVAPMRGESKPERRSR